MTANQDKRKLAREKAVLRRDKVDNAIYELLHCLAPSPIDWDIEAIGDVRDAVCDALCTTYGVMTEQDFYPDHSQTREEKIQDLLVELRELNEEKELDFDDLISFQSIANELASLISEK
jgi:hypothetical protein